MSVYPQNIPKRQAKGLHSNCTAVHRDQLARFANKGVQGKGPSSNVEHESMLQINRVITEVIDAIHPAEEENVIDLEIEQQDQAGTQAIKGRLKEDPIIEDQRQHQFEERGEQDQGPVEVVSSQQAHIEVIHEERQADDPNSDHGFSGQAVTCYWDFIEYLLKCKLRDAEIIIFKFDQIELDNLKAFLQTTPKGVKKSQIILTIQRAEYTYGQRQIKTRQNIKNQKERTKNSWSGIILLLILLGILTWLLLPSNPPPPTTPSSTTVTNFVLNSTAALSPTTAQQTVTSLTTQPSEAKDPILSTIFYVVLAIGVCLLVMKCLQWIWNSFSTWCLERRVDSS